MKQILDEYNRVEKIFSDFYADEHRKREYKDDREWWILGRLKLIFKKEKLSFPDFANKLSENDTDFVLSYDKSKVFKKLQVTELPPMELLERNSSLSNIDIWDKFQEILEKKLSHNFGPNNWLLIYFDNRLSRRTNYGYWHNIILDKTCDINHNNKFYERIIAIDAKGEAAVSIYPYLYVISPDWGAQSTIINEYLIRKNDYYKTIWNNYSLENIIV